MELLKALITGQELTGDVIEAEHLYCTAAYEYSIISKNCVYSDSEATVKNFPCFPHVYHPPISLAYSVLHKVLDFPWVAPT